MLRTRQFVRHLSAEGRSGSVSVGVRKQAGFDMRGLELFSPFACRILGSIAIDSGMKSDGGVVVDRIGWPWAVSSGHAVRRHNITALVDPSPKTAICDTADPLVPWTAPTVSARRQRAWNATSSSSRTRFASAPAADHRKLSGRVKQQAAPPFFVTTCLPAVSARAIRCRRVPTMQAELP